MLARLTAAAALALAAAAPAQAATVAPGDGVHRLPGSQSAVIAGQPFQVSGSAAPGARVLVSAAGEARTVPAGPDGRYQAQLAVAAPGWTAVRASEPGKPPASLRAYAADASVAPGASGLSVTLLQQSLAALKYAVSVDGTYGAGTGRAVMAYRKVNELARTPAAGPEVYVPAAAGQGGYKARLAGSGRHLEGDLTHQVLALFDARGLHAVYTVSTGRPGLRTPRGTFRIYRQTWGWNSHGMLDPSYFAHGTASRSACAIHGYPYVPSFPDSHCCFRVPVPDSRRIHAWIRVGDSFTVFGRQDGQPR